MQRPDPQSFAQASFALAIASSAIFSFAMVVGFFPRTPLSTAVQQVCWLSLFTSGIGAFLGWAARSDFRRRGVADTVPISKRARFGFLFNVVFFGLMVIGVLGVLVVTLINARPSDPMLFLVMLTPLV